MTIPPEIRRHEGALLGLAAALAAGIVVLRALNANAGTTTAAAAPTTDATTSTGDTVASGATDTGSTDTADTTTDAIASGPVLAGTSPVVTQVPAGYAVPLGTVQAPIGGTPFTGNQVPTSGVTDYSAPGTSAPVPIPQLAPINRATTGLQGESLLRAQAAQAQALVPGTLWGEAVAAGYATEHADNAGTQYSQLDWSGYEAMIAGAPALAAAFAKATPIAEQGAGGWTTGPAVTPAGQLVYPHANQPAGSAAAQAGLLLQRAQGT